MTDDITAATRIQAAIAETARLLEAVRAAQVKIAILQAQLQALTAHHHCRHRTRCHYQQN